MVHTISLKEMLAELGLRTVLTHHLLLGSVRTKAEYLGLGFKGGVGSGLDQPATVVVGLAARPKA